MISFFKTLRRDLKRPSDDDRHILARKKAFAIGATALGLLVATSMAVSGYAFMSIAYYSLMTFTGFFATTFLLFTNVRNIIGQWIDDHIINPPRPITLPNPNRRELGSKTTQYNESVNILKRAKTDTSITIGQIKAELKKIFALRSFTSLSMTQDKFDKLWQSFEKDYKKFKTNITNESDWKKQENLITLKKLAIDAVILTDQLFALLESDIRNDKKDVGTETVAQKLNDQSKIYRRIFLNNALIDLYHFARGIAVYQHTLTIKSEHSTEYLPEFYQETTKQNDIRKIYNTFIKHGFYLQYGTKAFREQLNNYGNVCNLWTQKDSKKKRKFSVYPSSRPN